MNIKTSCNSLPVETASCVVCGSEGLTGIIKGYDYQYWTSDTEFQAVTCSSCGHVYLNPRPTIAAVECIYPPSYYTLTGRHAGQSSRLVASMKKRIVLRRLKFFRQQFQRPIHVLDVGAGDCMLLIQLKEMHPHLKLTAIDIAFSQAARESAEASGIILIEENIEDVALQEKTYDLVIMNQLIEHLWEPRKVLLKINKALKPGGGISIETPNIFGYDRKFFRGGTWGGFYFPRHLNLFSFKSLAHLLRETGYEVVQQYSLLAVIVWTFSFKAFFCPTPSEKNGLIAGFFSDKNPLCLGIFSCVDMAAKLVGAITSNQKTIALKNTVDT